MKLPTTSNLPRVREYSCSFCFREFPPPQRCSVH